MQDLLGGRDWSLWSCEGSASAEQDAEREQGRWSGGLGWGNKIDRGRSDLALAFGVDFPHLRGECRLSISVGWRQDGEFRTEGTTWCTSWSLIQVLPMCAR